MPDALEVVDEAVHLVERPGEGDGFGGNFMHV